MHIASYDAGNLPGLCDRLADKDPDLRLIIDQSGYPTGPSRQPGFASLIRLILEQQVSLMSARAAYLKLVALVGEITAGKVAALSSEELRNCYFSRQKAVYARDLAAALLQHELDLEELSSLPDNEVRRRLTSVRGIGEWTADNYLLLCMHRTDVFPAGDIALINSLRKVKGLSSKIARHDILRLAEQWRPMRSIAAQLLWHAYIVDKKMAFEKLEY